LRRGVRLRLIRLCVTVCRRWATDSGRRPSCSRSEVWALDGPFRRGRSRRCCGMPRCGATWRGSPRYVPRNGHASPSMTCRWVALTGSAVAGGWLRTVSTMCREIAVRNHEA
jgi:hypothetical protein